MNLKFPWFLRRNRSTSTDVEVAGWVLKGDEGLSEKESAELLEKMEGDPEFAVAVREYDSAWELLDNLPSEMADELASDKGDRPIVFRPIWREVSIAAILIFGFATIWLSTRVPSLDRDQYFSETRSTLEPWTYRLPDGSVMRLNAGTKIKVDFKPDFRNVELLLGEVHVIVSKNAKRPFIVLANGVNVQAVGTAFNVLLQSNGVDVLVTEGLVQIERNEDPLVPNGGSTVSPKSIRAKDTIGTENLVKSGQLAAISFPDATSQFKINISQPQDALRSQTLAWQNALLTLGGASLKEIANDFERKTGFNLIIVDPALNDLKIGGTFSSNDFRSFLQVLKSAYEIPWEERSDGAFLIGIKQNS